VPIIDPILIALEDGDEIAVMSLLVTYLVSLAIPRDAAQVVYPEKTDAVVAGPDRT
jgi:hypothetical protein